MNGLPAQPANGSSDGQYEYLQPQDLSKVVAALEAIYSPQSSNDVRQAASSFLEQARKHPNAPAQGYELASDHAKPPALRHYGLSMIEYAVKYNWEEASEAAQEYVRGVVVKLGTDIQEQDPPYLRNKIAQLWTEIAKRSWGAEWMDMDAMLAMLWSSEVWHREFVLYVLETLSEEIFSKDDPTAGLRHGELAQACIEIFTRLEVLKRYQGGREAYEDLGVRHGDDGWLDRLCKTLELFLNDSNELQAKHTYVLKLLNTVRAALVWMMYKAISSTSCIEVLCKGLATGDIAIQTVCLDGLFSLLSRPNYQDDDFQALVCPFFTPTSVELLRRVYEWASTIDVEDIDEPKYTVCKKFSEVLAHIAMRLEERPQHVPDGCDVPGFFELLFVVVRHPSLLVSIPILHTWTKLLRSRAIKDAQIITQFVGGLMEICCQRLIRYESFPEDSMDPTYLFLNEDFDTMPERHSFVGNYRRFCEEVVVVTVRRLPLDATRHILGQAEVVLQELQAEQMAFQPRNFSKSASSVLRVDAHMTVINGVMKGYQKWEASQEANPQQNEQDRNAIHDLFETWSRGVMQLQFRDPEIQKRIVQLLATISSKALVSRPSFALDLLHYTLSISIPDDQSLLQYSEAVKGLQGTCYLEMQRLALAFPDFFLEHFQEIENKINSSLVSQGAEGTESRARMGWHAFLLIIIQRSTTLSADIRRDRLRQMITPISLAWQEPIFQQSLTSMDGFRDMLGLGHITEFFAANQFHKVEDWSAQQLDAQGQIVQQEILDRFNKLPLRLTKTYLQASTEKLEEGSQAAEIANELWADSIRAILPNLLHLVSYAQAFNDLNNWSSLPEELQMVMKRMLTDRFWQAGISTESKDDFFNRVSSSKTTYEGFASTIRGTVRQIREMSYWIIYGFLRFKNLFYGIGDLPGPLGQALYASADGLSAHHLSTLLNMSVQLIENCPPHLRESFLPEVVARLFELLTRRIGSEWEDITKRISQASDDDNLGEEMKNESILRNLTYTAVSFVAGLLDQHRTDLLPRDGSQASPAPPKMFTFITSTPSVIEPVLMFCKSALGMRDTRSCTTISRTLRVIIPLFRDNAPVREFICFDVLQAAITSLHEPYFVDTQKDLASLIASIICLDANTAGRVILSLPGMSERQEKVLKRITTIMNCPSERQARGHVLDLLSSVRGVSIHEQGRIERAQPKKRSAMQEQYMQVESQPAIVRGGSPELAGVADMFS